MEVSQIKVALENAGLSPYQADAYVALLELGSASAAELAEQSGVPGPRIYDVIRDLEDVGYVEMYEQGSLHARVHDPSAVLQDLEKRAEQFSNASVAIEEKWNEPAIEEHSISIVRRFDTVINRAAAEIANAQNQVQLSVTVDQFEALLPEVRSAKSNGAHVKTCIYNDGGSNGSKPASAPFEAACTEARYRELPAPFVAIVDRDQVCFAPYEDSVNQYGVIVNDRTHAYVFHSYFLTALWGQWDTIYSERNDDLPKSYVDMLYCMHDVDALVSDGASVTVAVTGEEVSSGEPIEFSGTVVDTRFETGPETEDRPFLTQLGGIISIFVETNDGIVTVGGWGAMIEDVEATRVTITAVEYADDNDRQG